MLNTTPGPSDDPSTSSGPVLRVGLLEKLAQPAPLTVVCGIPGTAKSTLIGQLGDYLAAHPTPGVLPHVVVRLPRRRLAEKSALRICAEAFMERRASSVGEADLMDRLRRGQVTPGELESRAGALRAGLDGVRVLLVNYEWSATPALDRLLVVLAQAGLDIVCPLVDADQLVSLAESEGVMARVFGDADLNFDDDEVARLVTRFGIEPDQRLISHLRALTGGHPMLTSMVVLRLAGVERADVSARAGHLTMTGVEGPARLPTPDGLSGVVPGSPLRRVDAESFGTEDLRLAAGFLRVQEFAAREFMETDQGVSGFMRFLVAFCGVPWADLDALADVFPGSSRYVKRLCDAGYAVLELGGGVSGRVVWKDGLRAVVGDWVRGAHGGVEDLGPRLARWYGEHGRLASAVEMIRGGGDVDLLEDFATAHFTEILMTDMAARQWSNLPVLRADGSRRPTVDILSEVEDATHRGGEDQRREALTETVGLLEDLRGEQTPGMERLDTDLRLLVALALQDRWSAHPGLGREAVGDLDEAIHRGWSDGAALERALLVIGVASLYRCEFDAARTALSRAVPDTGGVGTRPGPVDVALIAFDGYFGELREGSGADLLRTIDDVASAGEWSVWSRERQVLCGVARAWVRIFTEDYEGALDAMAEVAGEHLDALVRPFLLWTYGIVLLLNGRPEAAHAAYGSLWAMVEETRGNDGESPLVVLGATLAAIAPGHQREAAVLAARASDEAGSAVDLLFRLLVENSDPAALTISDRLAALANAPGPVPRARTLMRCVSAAVLSRGGEGERARDVLGEVAVLSRPRDVRFSCRFLTGEDCRRLAAMAAQGGLGTLAEVFAQAEGAPHAFAGPLFPIRLSPPERATLAGVSRGLTNAQIADELFVSVNTVKTHLQRVYRALGVRTRQEAATVARRWALVDP